mmetsp:Transcript_11918/g.20149  ORF Transcript_11918/g.20149 Transcript_11918/m.20149 type:complete len:84 (+) Transcript_11918:257-508(+)
MPERTTEDYEGVPSVKVQQAIQAILQEDANRESVPINTLINFNDSILEEIAEKAEGAKSSRSSTAASTARPKSGKRPKSVKKK